MSEYHIVGADPIGMINLVRGKRVPRYAPEGIDSVLKKIFDDLEKLSLSDGLYLHEFEEICDKLSVFPYESIEDYKSLIFLGVKDPGRRVLYTKMGPSNKDYFYEAGFSSGNVENELKYDILNAVLSPQILQPILILAHESRRDFIGEIYNRYFIREEGLVSNWRSLRSSRHSNF